MACRGVRGATTASANEPQAILAATRDLLAEMIQRNGIAPEDVGSVIFTATTDLDAAFPARAARELGWTQVPLLDAVEIPVPGSLPRCIRILAHWNTDKPQDQMQHVYLNGAQALRPDLGHRPAPQPTEEQNR